MAFLAPVVRYPEGLEPQGLEYAIQSRLPTFLRGFPTPVLAAVPALILLLLVALALPTRKAHPISVAADGTVRTKTPRTEPPTVLLAGPCGAGKTALFSHLVWGTVPSTHTSQREAEALARVKVHAEREKWTEEDSEKIPEQFADSPPRTSATQTVRLVDLPGHSRLRARAAEYVPAAHAVVFCVDATLASRASGSGAARAKDGNALSDAVDQLHSLLMSIARHRLSRSTRSKKQPEPPALLILFTRSDLSPLLASSQGTEASQRSKRSAQLLDKARTGLEAEMARRRAGMGLNSHHGRSAKIGGLSKVAGDGTERGIFASLLALVGLGSKSKPVVAATDEDEDDEDEDSIDYLDWEAAQRAQAAAAARNASAGGGVGALNAAPFSFDRLDEEVVWDGKAKWAIASVGKANGWSGGEREASADDTLDLRKWLAAL